MKIDKELFNYLARLARLKLEPAETQTLTEQLSRILGHVEQLNKIDVSGVEPLVHTLEQHNIFRPDKNESSLSKDKVLGNAPDQDKGFFKVPKVIEEL